MTVAKLIQFTRVYLAPWGGDRLEQIESREEWVPNEPISTPNYITTTPKTPWYTQQTPSTFCCSCRWRWLHYPAEEAFKLELTSTATVWDYDWIVAELTVLREEDDVLLDLNNITVISLERKKVFLIVQSMNICWNVLYIDNATVNLVTG